MTTAIDDRRADRADARARTRTHRPPRAGAGVVGGVRLVAACIAALGWGTFNVVELLAHEERTERFTVPAAELTRLYVDNDTGSVTHRRHRRRRDQRRGRGLRRTARYRASATRSSTPRSSCTDRARSFGSMWCRVTYRIEVPRGLDVEVNSDNGRVEVSNIDGDVVDQLRQRPRRADRRLRRDRRRR